MHYIVYILQSQIDKSYYTGYTEDLIQRIKDHNNGLSKYSSSKRPFILVWYCSFPDKSLAISFERYLKSGSGIAFRNKRLINYHNRYNNKPKIPSNTIKPAKRISIRILKSHF